MTSAHACTSTGTKASGSMAHTPWSPRTGWVTAPGMAAAARTTAINAPISSALVTAMASNTYVPFPQLSSMQLLCFIDKPVVNFKFQFKVGTNYNSFIGYRFDDKPGHEIGGQFIANAASVAIQEPAEVAQFVSELADSSVLYIRIRSFNAGRTTAEFKVDGARAAIASAYAGCPVKPVAPPVQAAPAPRRRSA